MAQPGRRGRAVTEHLARAPWPGRRPPKENAPSGLPSPRSCNRSGGNRRNVKRSWLRCVLNWSPPREQKKGGAEPAGSPHRRASAGDVGKLVISPPESSTVAAAAHATDNTPVVDPRTRCRSGLRRLPRAKIQTHFPRRCQLDRHFRLRWAAIGRSGASLWRCGS